MTAKVTRRAFITLLGGAAAWPLAARAQQPPVPVIGFLSSAAPGRISAFSKGLSEAGYFEGQNVTVEYRWTEGQEDRMQALAADFVRRPVTVIVTNTFGALAAKAVTAAIPIVFASATDPVKVGLVDSLARPGGNATGVNFFVADMGSKQLGLLHELVPTAARVGLLVNPNSPLTEPATKDVTAAAAAIGIKIEPVAARDSREIEAAFATLVRDRADALLVGPDLFLVNRRLQIATLAARHALPTVYNVREYPEAGGLMSYGTSVTEAYHQVGIYTGKILKGAKPADLPVMQSTKFELVINLPTARAIGLEIRPTLLARADEVIE